MGACGRVVGCGRRHPYAARRNVPRCCRAPQAGGIRLPAQPHRNGLGRGPIRRRLPHRVYGHGREHRAARADTRPRQVRPAVGGRRMEGRPAQRARGIRLLRHTVPQPPRHASPLSARRLGRIPPAQGLRSFAQPPAHEQRGRAGQHPPLRAHARRQPHTQARRHIRRG